MILSIYYRKFNYKPMISKLKSLLILLLILLLIIEILIVQEALWNVYIVSIGAVRSLSLVKILINCKIVSVPIMLQQNYKHLIQSNLTNVVVSIWSTKWFKLISASFNKDISKSLNFVLWFIVCHTLFTLFHLIVTVMEGKKKVSSLIYLPYPKRRTLLFTILTSFFTSFLL